MAWKRTAVNTASVRREAIAPEIISASRSTDIPAFYSEWLMNRLRAGYVKWVNPFSQKPQYVSFEKAKVIVFWSKNPAPLIPYLDEVARRGLAYYFQFTVNDYERERLEPRLAPLSARVRTFRELSARLGAERVIWRFDPLILAGDLSVKDLLFRVERIGDQLARHTSRLVFSFVDIEAYRKVRSRLSRSDLAVREFAEGEMDEAAEGISRLCRGWGIPVVTCAEKVDLARHGIGHGKCIDDDLILKITDNDPGLLRLLGREEGRELPLADGGVPVPKGIKDKGQREECGCVISKDIGQYNTCPHMCQYCYANTSSALVERNWRTSTPYGESIAGE